MSNNEFEDLLYTITANVVDLIMKKTGWNEDVALDRFVRSKIYSLVEKEETKVWHYSATMIAQLFEDERAGNLVLPEVM